VRRTVSRASTNVSACTFPLSRFAARCRLSSPARTIVGRTPGPGVPSGDDAPVGLRSIDEADFIGASRSRGTRADQGVRPTVSAGFAALGKQRDLPADVLSSASRHRLARYRYCRSGPINKGGSRFRLPPFPPVSYTHLRAHE